MSAKERKAEKKRLDDADRELSDAVRNLHISPCAQVGRGGHRVFAPSRVQDWKTVRTQLIQPLGWLAPPQRHVAARDSALDSVLLALHAAHYSVADARKSLLGMIVPPRGELYRARWFVQPDPTSAEWRPLGLAQAAQAEHAFHDGILCSIAFCGNFLDRF